MVIDCSSNSFLHNIHVARAGVQKQCYIDQQEGAK